MRSEGPAKNLIWPRSVEASGYKRLGTGAMREVKHLCSSVTHGNLQRTTAEFQVYPFNFACFACLCTLVNSIVLLNTLLLSGQLPNIFAGSQNLPGRNPIRSLGLGAQGPRLLGLQVSMCQVHQCAINSEIPLHCQFHHIQTRAKLKANMPAALH